MASPKYSLIYIMVIACFIYERGKTAETNTCGNLHEIPCDNSECIPRVEWCDGKRDCADRTDEKYCQTLSWWSSGSDCKEKHFSCDNGRCIPAVAKCDSFDDCGDDSDEKHCDETTNESTAYTEISRFGDERNVEPDPTELTQLTTDPFSSFDSDERLEYPSMATTRSTTSTTKPTPPMRPSISALTPSLSADEDYYKRKQMESTDVNQQTYYPPSYYQQNPYGTYDPHNQFNQNRNRASDTKPSQNFPANENWVTPRYAIRTTMVAAVPHYSTPYPYRGRDNLSRTTVAPIPQYSTPSSYRGRDDLSRTTVASIPQYSTPYFHRGRDDSSRTVRNSFAQRQPRIVIQPRTVLYPPSRLYDTHTKKTQNPVLPLFYFAKNYTQQYGYYYNENVRKAEQWLLRHRDDSYSWDKDTPRALVAFSLITNSFTSDIADNDLMKKSLQTHLGLKLLRNKTETLSTTRLALYVNALLATCQNPRDFLNLNLVDILNARRNNIGNFRTGVNPSVYLSLCLSDADLNWRDIQPLESLLAPRFQEEIAKDRYILATTAMSCFLQKFAHEDAVRNYLWGKVDEAARHLLSQQRRDGSFGSIYTTAIAAQALMSINSTSWDPKLTLAYLASLQDENGSFGDMLSTYYILPVLRGRSLLHIRNTLCDQTAVNETLSPRDILDRPGPKKSVLYTLDVANSQWSSMSLLLTVPEETNFFDIMRVGAYLDPRFRFDYKITNGKIHVYTISNIPNDPERGLYWNLYQLQPSDREVDFRNLRRYDDDILALIPADREELLFWYLPNA